MTVYDISTTEGLAANDDLDHSPVPEISDEAQDALESVVSATLETVDLRMRALAIAMDIYRDIKPVMRPTTDAILADAEKIVQWLAKSVDTTDATR